MKILVTGGAGFIGSHLVDHLVEFTNHEIYNVDNLNGGFWRNINPGCKFTKLELRNRKATERYFKKNFKDGLDILVHCAASAQEGRSVFTPNVNADNNDLAYRNTLIPAINCGVKKVVLFSSLARYGNGWEGKYSPPFSENTPPYPIDPYGISKLSMELLTKSLSREAFNFKWTIIVPHNVYGERQNIADPYRNLMGIFMNLIMQNKSVYIYGNGNQRRAFSYYEDSISCMAKCLFDEKTNGEIINIGGLKDYTVNEVYEILAEISGTSLKPNHISDRPNEVKCAYCTHKKAEELLGLKESYSLKAALTRMWKWANILGPKKFVYMKNLELESDKVPKTWSQKLF